MANMAVKTGKKWGRAAKTRQPPADGETIARRSVEIVTNLNLKKEPDLVDGILALAEQAGYQTVPDAVRHAIRAGLSLTPMDAEARAAINSIKGQMTQYFAKMFWNKMAEMMVDFHKDWTPAIFLAKFEEEMKRIKAERGEFEDA